MAAVQRQPFGELGASRLQSLSSQKNYQNAVADTLSNKTEVSFKKPLPTPTVTKRPWTPSDENDSDLDTENVDPTTLFSKSKPSKDQCETPSKKYKPSFSLNVSSGLPSSTVNRIGAPTSHAFGKAPNTPNGFSFSTSGANSAPAGRSPKSKRTGLLGKKRGSMSPFKRVNPPSFGSAARGGLPFSIDAALSGTLSSAKNRAPTCVPSSTSAATISTPLVTAAFSAKAVVLEECMPSSWFFSIHEDTAEEEAANLMEHSTGILDISSDDEATPRKADDRGKENVPPADHTDSNGNATQSDSARASVRLCKDLDTMKDVGEERAPLGSLDAEAFYGKGLDKASIEIVKPDVEDDGKHQVDENTYSPASVQAESGDDSGAQTSQTAVAEQKDAQVFQSDAKWVNGIAEPLPVDAQTGTDADAVPGFEIAED